MPAYAKLALVTPTFHPSDIAFARGWSRRAPGLGGWTVLLDNDAAPEQVSVIPPGGDRPVFYITRQGRSVTARYGSWHERHSGSRGSRAWCSVIASPL